MLTAEEVKDIAQRWAEYPILQELAASHEELRADLEAAERANAALKEQIGAGLTEHSKQAMIDIAAEQAEENAALMERQAEAIKRLDGADYDIGRTLADDFESDRLMDAQRGVREARALLTPKPPADSAVPQKEASEQ